MRTAEKAAFARGISAEALMNHAGAAIAEVVRRFFPRPGRCLVFVGKGNNGGDALVAAKHLREKDWKVELRLSFSEEDCGELTRKKLQSLREIVRDSTELDGGPAIVLDGLLGLGAKPPLREPVRQACREINRLRRETNAYVFAIDLPTGLDGDSGRADRDTVAADFTITVGFAKRGLLADSALDFVGRLEVVELPLVRGPATASPSDVVATAASLCHLLPRREFGAYKNQFGRVGIVAGSKGLTGAAIMCATGALRAGAGLVEVFVPEEIYNIVAAAVPAEAMVKPVQSYADLLDEKVDVWGIGPGLGKERASEIMELVKSARQPMVVDADALNILARNTRILARCEGPRLLTPHPGEMKRLFGRKKESRAKTAKRFCTKFPVTLLFKGSRTIVAQHGEALSYNTTGNPGMATGGMGDVLTGVCAALIGQKLSPYDAARLGAWLCGRAAEMAIFCGNVSEESLLPRDLLDHLGFAFNDLRDAVV